MPCVIAVRVTPRSSRPGIADWKTCANGREELEIRVSAPPADGEANEAVIKLLSKRLGLSKSSVAIVSGDMARHKRISLPLDEAEVRQLLAHA